MSTIHEPIEAEVAAAAAEEDTVDVPLVLAEWDYEEVLIDGICGVY